MKKKNKKKQILVQTSYSFALFDSLSLLLLLEFSLVVLLSDFFFWLIDVDVASMTISFLPALCCAKRGQHVDSECAWVRVWLCGGFILFFFLVCVFHCILQLSATWPRKCIFLLFRLVNNGFTVAKCCYNMHITYEMLPVSRTI